MGYRKKSSALDAATATSSAESFGPSRLTLRTALR